METLTAADKAAIKDELVRELKKKIDTTALQVARVGPTLTATNRRTYEDSMNKSIQDLREQIDHVQASELRPFGPQERITKGALVKARFEPAGLPSSESWILIVPGISQRRLAYQGHAIEAGPGSFGFGGSLLGLRVGESSHVYGDGRSIPAYNVAILRFSDPAGERRHFACGCRSINDVGGVDPRPKRLITVARCVLALIRVAIDAAARIGTSNAVKRCGLTASPACSLRC